jgi:shikimate kinase
VKSSIALVGFMGTGKTVVGRLLAQKTGRDFVELDAVIAAKAGRPIPEIFRSEGEIGFREREIEAVRQVAGKKNAVIACGGGVVLNTINIDRLRRECTVVCLTASPAVILARTSSDGGGRPLLDVDDRERQVKELLASRQPYYKAAADIIVNTSRLTPEKVVARIIEKLSKMNFASVPPGGAGDS